MNVCNHVPGDGCTLVTASDSCSLECTVCHEMVVELELVAVLIDGDDIEWVG
jgi:hypothetical protein